MPSVYVTPRFHSAWLCRSIVFGAKVSPAVALLAGGTICQANRAAISWSASSRSLGNLFCSHSQTRGTAKTLHTKNMFESKRVVAVIPALPEYWTKMDSRLGMAEATSAASIHFSSRNALYHEIN